MNDGLQKCKCGRELVSQTSLETGVCRWCSIKQQEQQWRQEATKR